FTLFMQNSAALSHLHTRGFPGVFFLRIWTNQVDYLGVHRRRNAVGDFVRQRQDSAMDAGERLPTPAKALVIAGVHKMRFGRGEAGPLFGTAAVLELGEALDPIQSVSGLGPTQQAEMSRVRTGQLGVRREERFADRRR